jgi:hypothetical protein
MTDFPWEWVKFVWAGSSWVPAARFEVIPAGTKTRWGKCYSVSTVEKLKRDTPWNVMRKIAEESGIEVIEDQPCPPGVDIGNQNTWKGPGDSEG